MEENIKYAQKRCSICGTALCGGFKNHWYCKECYIKYRPAIFVKEEWVIFLRNEERSRRRKLDPPTVYLGSEWDLDNEGNLVPMGDYDGR